jgi:tetratricopeptide (TPR) repeat protein
MMTILDNTRYLRLAVLVLGSCVAGAEQDDLAAARSYVDRNMLPAAEAEARRVVATHPDSAPAHYLLGYILFRQSKARESLAEYTEGAKHHHPDAADLRVVGADYVLLNAYGDADKWFTKATELDPGNVLGWYYLGRTKYNENRFEEAITAFKHCLELAPRHVRAEDNLGLSYQGLGRSEEAFQAFRNAIDWQGETAQKDPWPHIDMGSFLLESNRPEDAIPYLQQAIAFVPQSPKAHQQLGKAYLALKHYDKAQSELESAVKLDPESAPVHYVLGQLYQHQGQAEKAKEEFALYARLKASKRPEARP